MIDPGRPQSTYVNRVLGLGSESLPDLPRVLQLYEDSAMEPQLDLEPDVAPEVADALLTRGFRPVESLSFLVGATRPAAGPEPTSVRVQRNRLELPAVERWGADRADDFLRLLMTSGVICKPAVWSERRSHYCTETFRVYVASLGGEPRAWATLFVSGKAGYAANAYTQEDWRGRGCQTALLRERQSDAAALGVDWLMTDVEHGSSSHGNCTRAGFSLATVVTAWRRPTPDKSPAGTA